MLHPKLIAGFGLIFLIVLSLYRTAETTSRVRRVTSTSEEIFNLNPSLSGDGRFLAFESSFDLADAGGNGFHALRADLASDPANFEQMGTTRAVTPAVSQDGSHIAFASTDNPLGTNRDGNSEIFLYRSRDLIQITNTTAEDHALRLSQGNFQPSISDDGRVIVFSSNCNLTDHNPDRNLEIFIIDTTNSLVTQLTHTSGLNTAKNAKISGEGNTVAYIADNNVSHELILCNLAGDQSTRVITSGLSAISMASGRTISDDGLRVVYSAETAPDTTQLFLWDGRNDVTRQLTNLETREDDVPLNGTISGDGLRVAFATRRDVIGGNRTTASSCTCWICPQVRSNQLLQRRRAPPQK